MLEVKSSTSSAPTPETTREDDPIDVTRQSKYGFHKYLAEQCVRHAAKRHLVTIGYDRAYGGRPLKRAIQREIESPLAKLILKGEIRDGLHVIVDLSKGDLTFTPKK